MNRRFVYLIVVMMFIASFAFLQTSTSHADTLHAPRPAGSAFDLINAVNALRASNGLPAYSINSILMYTAQNQADFMAATGTVTHSGPGGISLTDRLLAAGYPLAGDLSLGGFRAENITSGGENMPAEAAVNQWTGDAPHLNTMLSPNLTEIGAGVAIQNGRVYYVIDAAHPTTGGAPQAAPVLGGGSAFPPNETPVSFVVISTPNADGDTMHDVLAGQTLWQIAVSYDVEIDDIKRLNNLFDDYIFPGESLLIKKGEGGVTATPTPTEAPTATINPIQNSSHTLTLMKPTAVFISTSVPDRASPDNSTIMGVALGIIALALLGGGVFTWLGNSKKE